jgi:hypothetical protein
MCTLTQVGDLPRLAYLLEIKRAQPSSCAVRPGAVIGLGLGVKAFWYLGDLLIEAAKSIGWKAALPFPPRGRPNLRRRDFQGTTAQRGVLIMPIGGADNADSGTDRAVKGSDNADMGTMSLILPTGVLRVLTPQPATPRLATAAGLNRRKGC